MCSSTLGRSVRLRGAGYESELNTAGLRFCDYDGLSLELVVADPSNPALIARHPEIPAEQAIVGIEGARAYGGAGSVHHIAWAASDEDHLSWRQRTRDAGCPVTDVRDRDYFKSIYFREPRGILFEIATLSPGFAIDEDPDHLGERLALPAMHEHLRTQLEQTLTPVVNPRSEPGQSLQT